MRYFDNLRHWSSDQFNHLFIYLYIGKKKHLRGCQISQPSTYIDVGYIIHFMCLLPLETLQKKVWNIPKKCHFPPPFPPSFRLQSVMLKPTLRGTMPKHLSIPFSACDFVAHECRARNCGVTIVFATSSALPFRVLRSAWYFSCSCGWLWCLPRILCLRSCFHFAPRAETDGSVDP